MSSRKTFTKGNAMSKKDDLAVEEVQKQKTTRLATKVVPTEKQTGCCMGTKDCATTPDVATHHHKAPTAATYSTGGGDIKKGPKTRITVKYDIGFGNYLFLRGKGANLSWEKGVALKNVKNDEWVWETDLAFTSCEFKVLINDSIYEIGDNHTLTCGASIQYTPRFQ